MGARTFLALYLAANVAFVLWWLHLDALVPARANAVEMECYETWRPAVATSAMPPIPRCWKAGTPIYYGYEP